VANQIAAGEVIQRPSSVVKELLENSLDAGSSEINLVIKDAGRTLIQIIDNGSGMSHTDLHMCFKRHATSKIKNAKDLFSIHTMGFRGEALAAIAAISHVEVDTKLTNHQLGYNLIIEGGKIKKEEECSITAGTSIKVKNLFYNVPARRNFLKSDKVEMRHIMEEFTRFSLANPQIKTQLFHNKNEIFHLPATNLRHRIINIIGERKNETLVPVEETTSMVEINGFIGKPELAKKTRGEQYFFVNGRFIKDYYLNHAINKAFEDLIPDNYFPSYFINIKIDPKLIDVNIHPTKTEVKFEDEKAIYAIMKSCVKRSLGQYNIAPTLDFSQELAFNIPSSFKQTIIKEPEIRIDSSYNPFSKTELSSENSFSEEIPLEVEEKEITNNIMQIQNKYIVFSDGNGLVILNQRRAHKRILFEYLSNMIEKNTKTSQELLFRKEISLNHLDIEIIKMLKEDLLAVGFKFEIQEKKGISIIAIPPECQEENLQFIIEHLIEQHKNNEKLETTQNNALAISLSKSLAINKNTTLTLEEMLSLKNKLLSCSSPNICPSGKLTMINLPASDLEKYF
tara:strand:+ start:1672 stop:3369 length:1698 start_codon:yes stop_codon:yes gene_type:complete